LAPADCSSTLPPAARTLGLQLVVANASTDSDLETAFASFSQQGVGAVLVGPSSFYIRGPAHGKLAALAVRHALPAMFPFRESVLTGGLMSYGTTGGYLWRQVGIYAGRIRVPRRRCSAQCAPARGQSASAAVRPSRRAT
jgi:putative ABC transport system substrate-binding protein